MLILLVRGVIDLGDALLDHDMQPQVQVRGQEVHAAKPVNEPIDVQVQPGVEDDERRLQRHKDNHEEAGGRPHGLVTGISRLILQDGDLGCNSIDILDGLNMRLYLSLNFRSIWRLPKHVLNPCLK